MPIRKKLSQRFMKAKPASPERLHLPPSSPPSLLPAVQLGAPLVDSLSTARLSEPAKQALNQTHRRSQSFSALQPPSRSFPDFFPSPRESSGSCSSQYTEYNDQPWRSQDVWKALHSPATSLSPASGLCISLTHPVMLNGTGGWKSGNTEGLFSGRQNPQPRKLALPAHHGSMPGEPGSSDRGWEDYPSNPDDQGRYAVLQPLLRMDFSSPRQHIAQHSSLLPRRSVSWKSPIRNTETFGEMDTSPSRHCPGNSLLPPLMPCENVHTPQRSSSLAAAHARRDPAAQPVTRSKTDGAHKPGPVAWARRLSFDLHPALSSDSAPERPPKSERRGPEPQLPIRPRSTVQVHAKAQSGKLSVESSPPSSLRGEDERSGEEDETSQEGSSTMTRERLVTPVTPPSAFCHDTSGSTSRSDSRQAEIAPLVQTKPWGVAGKHYRSNVTRGGWI